MEFLKTLLEATDLTAAQQKKARALLEEKARVYELNAKRLAVLEAITKTLSSEQTDLESGMVDLMRQLGNAQEILNGVNVEFKEGGTNAGRTSYQKVAEEMTAELKKYDKEAERVYTGLVEKFRGEGTAKKPVLKVTTTALGEFFKAVASTSVEDLLKRVGMLEKFPELIQKEKARSAKKGAGDAAAVNEGVADDAKKILGQFRDSLARAVKALMPRAKSLVATAERIKAIAAKA